MDRYVLFCGPMFVRVEGGVEGLCFPPPSRTFADDFSSSKLLHQKFCDFPKI